MNEKYKDKYLDASEDAFKKALSVVPYKTGNLRYNAIRYSENNNKAVIRLALGIAPYGEYIDRIGYRTHGWWDKFIDEYTKNIQLNTNARRES